MVKDNEHNVLKPEWRSASGNEQYTAIEQEQKMSQGLNQLFVEQSFKVFVDRLTDWLIPLYAYTHGNQLQVSCSEMC